MRRKDSTLRERRSILKQIECAKIGLHFVQRRGPEEASESGSSREDVGVDDASPQNRGQGGDLQAAR